MQNNTENFNAAIKAKVTGLYSGTSPLKTLCPRSCNTRAQIYMNDERKTMKPIYSNFDGFDLSFQCAVPAKILDTLAEAKKQAQETKGDAVTKIGKNNVIVLVSETGGKGGYPYRFDTGIDGATWMIANNPKRDKWNIRVSIKSLALALYGYEEVKKKTLEFLVRDLGALGTPHINKQTGEVTDAPLERISRMDFCIDFKTDKFIPDIYAFVGKGRFKKRILNLEDQEKSKSEIVFSGRKIKYVRIGSMPNREAVLYDKISDITDKKKDYWWDIWKIKKSEFKGQIWRVEVRAGKKELNKWNLRRFSDFEKMAGDVMSGILKDIKYTIPSTTDKNITRWPLAPFWQEAINITEEKLQNHISHAERKMIIEGYRKQMSDQFEKSILGQTVSYAALHGIEMTEIPRILDVLGESLLERIHQNPQKFQEKHQNATDKYSQLEN